MQGKDNTRGSLSKWIRLRSKRGQTFGTKSSLRLSVLKRGRGFQTILAACSSSCSFLLHSAASPPSRPSGVPGSRGCEGGGEWVGSAGRIIWQEEALLRWLGFLGLERPAWLPTPPRPQPGWPPAPSPDRVPAPPPTPLAPPQALAPPSVLPVPAHSLATRSTDLRPWKFISLLALRGLSL